MSGTFQPDTFEAVAQTCCGWSRSVKVAAALGALILAGCADPAKARLKYLNSGREYASQRKYQAAVIQLRNALQADPNFADAHHELARAYAALGKTGAAFEELERTVALDPGNAVAQLDLAASLLTRKEYDRAQAVANLVLRADPRNGRAHATLAAGYALRRDTGNAMVEFRKAIDLDPARVEYYGNLAALQLSSGRLAEALATHDEAIRRNPKSVEARVGLGEFFFSQGKLDEAAAQLQIAAGLDPHAVEPRLLLAHTFAAMKRFDSAEKLNRELKTIAPDDPIAYQALGLFYLSTGQKQNAAAELQSLAAAKPADNSVKALLVEVLTDLNRFAAAAQVDEQLLRSDPSSFAGLLAHGRILIAQGEFQEASTELNKAIKIDSASAPAFYFLGVAQRSLGLTAMAKNSFNRALALRPRMTEATLALADLAATAGSGQESARLAGEAVKSSPESVAPYVASARASLARNDTREGAAFLAQALARDPVSLPALAMWVKLNSMEGKSREAVARLSSLLAQQPENAGLHFLLAVSYYDLKELGKAGESLRTAMRLNPHTPGAYTLLADIDYAKGEAGKAESDLQTAIQRNPRNISNYLVLGAWKARQGKWEETRKLWERAHELDPASPVAADQLAFLYLEHGGDVSAALALAQTAKRAAPDSAPAADTLGWAYYKMGSPGLAIPQLRLSLQKEPANPIYLYHLGMAYLAQGNPQSARGLLQQALDKTPNFAYSSDARDALNKIANSKAKGPG